MPTISNRLVSNFLSRVQDGGRFVALVFYMKILSVFQSDYDQQYENIAQMTFNYGQRERSTRL